MSTMDRSKMQRCYLLDMDYASYAISVTPYQSMYASWKVTQVQFKQHQQQGDVKAAAIKFHRMCCIQAVCLGTMHTLTEQNNGIIEWAITLTKMTFAPSLSSAMPCSINSCTSPGSMGL